MTPTSPPNGSVAVRLDHLEEVNRHRDIQCGQHQKMIAESRSRLDRLEGKLWVLWPILVLMLVNAAALAAKDYFK